MQFLLIGTLFFILPWQVIWAIVPIQITAVAIGLWAVQAMHLGHFNIVPDPMPEMRLVTTGPYQYIRHPRYFWILLFFMPMVALNANLSNLSALLLLISVLLVKLHYEERLLNERLTDYSRYQTKTKKLIPFLS